MKIKHGKIWYCGIKNPYTFIDGALTAVTIKYVCVDLLECRVAYIVIMPDGSERTINDEKIEFYANEYKYNEGQPIDVVKTSLETLVSKLGVITVSMGNGNDCYEFEPRVWIMKDGEPVEVAIDIVNMKLCRETDSIEADITYKGEKVEKFYDSRDFCLQMNDYKVIDEDGNEKMVRGPLKRLQVTPEQQVYVDAVIAAIKAAKEAGVRFAFESSYEAFYPINANEIEWSNGDETQTYNDENRGFFLGFKGVRSGAFQSIGFYDYYINDDCYGIDIQFKAQ